MLFFQKKIDVRSLPKLAQSATKLFHPLLITYYSLSHIIR